MVFCNPPYPSLPPNFDERKGIQTTVQRWDRDQRRKVEDSLRSDRCRDGLRDGQGPVSKTRVGSVKRTGLIDTTSHFKEDDGKDFRNREFPSTLISRSERRENLGGRGETSKFPCIVFLSGSGGLLGEGRNGDFIGSFIFSFCRKYSKITRMVFVSPPLSSYVVCVDDLKGFIFKTLTTFTLLK